MLSESRRPALRPPAPGHGYLCIMIRDDTEALGNLDFASRCLADHDRVTDRSVTGARPRRYSSRQDGG